MLFFIVNARARNPVPLSVSLKRGRLRLAGHIARLNDSVPAKKILTAVSQPPPAGWHRPRGRPRQTWASQIAAFRLTQDLIAAAADRRDFKRPVAIV